MKNLLFIVIVLTSLSMSCGVKSDVVPPDEPWVIFENPKKIKKNKTNDEKNNLEKK